MRAILIATGHAAGLEALIELRPASMLPLLDRPFLQHVLEYLIDQGILEFDLLLSDHPDQIEKHFADGKRWGCSIRYFLARDAATPYRALQALPAYEGVVLLAHCDRLPLLPRATGDVMSPILFEADRGEWTGWAVIPGNLVGKLAQAGDFGDAERLLRETISSRTTLSPVLATRSYADLLAAHRIMLDRAFPNLLLTGRQAEESIWISRNVSIHPSARLTAPVFIGENCRIGEGNQIGPYASIGAGCMLDRQALVRESVVLPGSYVGEGLEIQESIVDRNRLVNVSIGAELTIAEDFLLGSIAGRGLEGRAVSAAGRIVAALLSLAFLPATLLAIVVLALARRSPRIFVRQIVRIPTSGDRSQWRTAGQLTLAPPDTRRSTLADFFVRFLPGLWCVAIGRLSLVGAEPRTREEVEALPHDWRSLYLRTKAGLITECFIQHGPAPSVDDQYACESFYAVSAGIRLDFSILLRYARRLLGLGPSRHTEAGAGAHGGGD